MSLRVHRLLPDPIAILTGALLGGLDYRFRGRSRVYHREAMRLLVEHTPRAVELDRVARDHAIEHAITVTMMLAPWLLSRALAEGREYLETAVNHPGSVVVGFVRTGAFPSMIALKQYAELRPTVVTVAPFILAGRLDGLKVASVCSLARRLGLFARETIRAMNAASLTPVPAEFESAKRLLSVLRGGERS